MMSRLKAQTITIIIVANLIRIAIFAMIIVYVYQLKKEKTLRDNNDNNIQKKSYHSIKKSIIESKNPLTKMI